VGLWFQAMFCIYCRAVIPEDAVFCSACGRGLTPVSASRQGLDSLAGMPTEMGLPAGALLIDRYQIQESIGLGGMGQVYLAEDVKLKTPVAVKVMRDILSRDPGSVARLMAEAKHAMQLSHPNIVRVHNFEDGGHVKFLVMEYVEGETLAHRIAALGKLEEEATRRIVIEVCKGLEHAHQKKVIHRDLKPANVLLGNDGSVKIADFGIARACRDSVSRLTMQPDDSGTLPYMSPEQMMGVSSAAGDIYSLGVMLYEMLSGETPFHTGDIAAQIRARTPEPLESVSPALNALVLRCLEKKPEQRFPHVSNVREELEGKAEQRRQEELRRAQVEERRQAEIESRLRAEEEGRKRAEEAERMLAEEKRRRAEAEARAAAQAGPTAAASQPAPDILAQTDGGKTIPLPVPPPPRRAAPDWGAWIRQGRKWLLRALAACAAIILLVILGYLAWAWRGGYVAAKDLPAVAGGAKSGSPAPDGMVWIPPGSFWMGSWELYFTMGDTLPHRVRIERGFWMDATEVTYEAYRRFILANPQWQKDRIDPRYHNGKYLFDWNGNEYRRGLDNYPVFFVSWYAARAFAEWAGKRLPTEAEWEYACRAGTTTTYWWGNEFDPARANGNERGALPPQERHRNPWGLYEMSGNLWEWTSSAKAPYPYRSDDGREGRIPGLGRVLRGGSWSSQWVQESTYRGSVSEDLCNDATGFRCAR
jgi:formylglycine-generating enzyme required for sulfatase activity